MEFNRQNLKTVREDIINALEAVKTKYSMTELSLGNISFTQDHFNVKLTARLKQIIPKLAPGMSGIIGKTFIWGNKKFTITDYRERRWKRPVVAKNEHGKSFVFSDDVIKNLLN